MSNTNDPFVVDYYAEPPKTGRGGHWLGPPYIVVPVILLVGIILYLFLKRRKPN
jgi:hypothetical protein